MQRRAKNRESGFFNKAAAKSAVLRKKPEIAVVDLRQLVRSHLLEHTKKRGGDSD